MGHTVRDYDGGKTRAIPESIPSDTFYSIADGNGGKALAASENFCPYTRHPIGDGDGGQVVTSIVFVYICVSKPSRQNGRKVTRKYIRIAEKIKI